MVTSRAISDILAASKTTLRKLCVQVPRILPDQMRKYLALIFAWQIRAGGWRSDEELRKIAALNAQIQILEA